MRPVKRQRGVTLVAVIFLIVVLGAAVTVLARLSAQSTAQTTQTLLQARARQAATAGIEWAVRTLIEGGDCGDIDGETVTVPAYTDYDVNLGCTEAGPYNRNQQISLFRLQAEAEYGAPDDPDYVWTMQHATVELD